MRESGSACPIKNEEGSLLRVLQRFDMIILGIDLGKVRTGIAICDKAEMLAIPLKTITQHDRQTLFREIADLAEENRAEALVLGLPRNMDGSEGESAKLVREAADQLSQLTGLTAFFSDERGTTITATGYLNATNTRGKKRKASIDSLAATIILQDFLDLRKIRHEREQEK